MEEHFSFFPCSVPKEDGNYKGKAIEDWSWRDFQNYFDDSVSQKLNKRPPCYNIKSQKGVVEAAFKLRGKETLKAMIDWVFDNRSKYPQWSPISMNLVCGKHGWANMIAENAEKAIKTGLDFSDEEI